MSGDSPGCVILASAGTGKTFALTNRLIALLAAGEDPAGIIAATFTRKAAGEILGRLLERLAKAVVEPAALDELREHADARLDAARCAALLDGLIRRLDRLQIVTIDALFIRLAGLFGLEAGLPPTWRIVDEAEDDDLRAEALHAALAEDPERTQELLRMLAGRRPAARSVLASARELVDASLAAVIATRGAEAAWTAIAPNPAELMPADAAGPALRRFEGAAAHVPLTQRGEPHKNYLKAHEKAVIALGSRRFKDFLADGLASKIVADTTKFGSAEIPEAMLAAYRPWVAHARAVELRTFAQRNAAVRALAERFARHYFRTKRRLGAFGFDDIPRLLLERHHAGALEPLYYRLDARVRHVLLDEFQDTSLEQFRLLEPVLAELLAGAGAAVETAVPRSVLCVGDEKQSLYAWRNAEPTLLPHLPRRWPQLQRRTLTRNFRSSPVILGVVNSVFGSLAANVFLRSSAAAAALAGAFTPHTAGGRNAALGGAARVLVAAPPARADADAEADEDHAPEADKPGLAEARRACLDLAARRVIALARARPGWSIAVLLRTNQPMGALVHALRTAGIDAVKEGGNPLIDTPVIAALVSLLRATAHPGDSAALYHVASGPLGPALGLPSREPREAAPVLAALRARIARAGLVRFLSDLRAPLAPALGPRAAERFEQAVDLAMVFTARHGNDARAFAEHLTTQGVDEPGAGRVRVTTIHKAKGLEFDAVIAPELDRSWQPRGAGVLVARDAEAGPLAPPVLASLHPDELIQRLAPAARQGVEQAVQREYNQELCSLYVALTRPRQLLEIIIPPAPAPSALEKLPAHPSGAKIIHAALAPTIDAAAGETLWVAEGSDASLFAPEEPPAPRRVPHAVTPPPAAHAVPPTAPPAAPLGRDVQPPPVWRLRRVSPSGLEGTGSVRLGELFRPPTGTGTGRALGSLLHAWFELVEWGDDAEPADAALLAAAERLGVDPSAAREPLAAFRAALRRPALRARLSRGHYPLLATAGHSVRVCREWPLAVRLPNPARAAGEGAADVLLTGFADRVVIIERDGRPVAADLLDFKTDAVDPAADADAFAARVEHYRPQVAAYRAALRRRLGLGDEALSAALLFTRAGVTVEMPA